MATMAEAAPAVFSTDCEREPFAAGWTTVGNAAIGQNLFWSDRQAHSGTHSLAIMPLRAYGNDAGWESAPFAVKPGQHYQAAFYAKAERSFYFAVVFYDAHGALLEGDYHTQGDAAAEWTQYTFIFQTKYPATTAALVYRPASGGSCYFDDIAVTAVDHTQARAWANQLYATMPPVQYQAPADAGQYLPRTLSKLRRGGPFRIVLLGDSISNDMSNSPLDVLLEEAFPKAQIETRFTGRGGTGWMKYQHQIAERVAAHKPDLVILLAISNEPAQIPQYLPRIIAQIRRDAPQAEMLLMTPHMLRLFRGTDAGVAHRDALLPIAREQKVELFDLMAATEGYLAANGKPYEWMLRDPIHMNERGRQIMARTVTAYLAQAAKGK